MGARPPGRGHPPTHTHTLGCGGGTGPGKCTLGLWAGGRDTPPPAEGAEFIIVNDRVKQPTPRCFWVPLWHPGLRGPAYWRHGAPSAASLLRGTCLGAGEPIPSTESDIEAEPLECGLWLPVNGRWSRVEACVHCHSIRGTEGELQPLLGSPHDGQRQGYTARGLSLGLLIPYFLCRQRSFSST